MPRPRRNNRSAEADPTRAAGGQVSFRGFASEGLRRRFACETAKRLAASRQRAPPYESLYSFPFAASFVPSRLRGCLSPPPRHPACRRSLHPRRHRRPRLLGRRRPRHQGPAQQPLRPVPRARRRCTSATWATTASAGSTRTAPSPPSPARANLATRGDGGPATAAQLNEPYEVRFRGGDMFFVEMKNHRRPQGRPQDRRHLHLRRHRQARLRRRRRARHPGTVQPAPRDPVRPRRRFPLRLRHRQQPDPSRRAGHGGHHDLRRRRHEAADARRPWLDATCP